MAALGTVAIAGCNQPDTTTFTAPDKQTAVSHEDAATDHEVSKLAKVMADADAAKLQGKGGKRTKGATQSRKIASVAAKPMVYIVQVGAFKVKENAYKLEARLKGDGFPVSIRSMNHSKNGALHLVRFEPTPNREEANNWVSQLKTKSDMGASVLAQPDEN